MVRSADGFHRTPAGLAVDTRRKTASENDPAESTLPAPIPARVLQVAFDDNDEVISHGPLEEGSVLDDSSHVTIDDIIRRDKTGGEESNSPTRGSPVPSRLTTRFTSHTVNSDGQSLTATRHNTEVSHPPPEESTEISQPPPEGNAEISQPSIKDRILVEENLNISHPSQVEKISVKVENAAKPAIKTVTVPPSDPSHFAAAIGALDAAASPVPPTKNRKAPVSRTVSASQESKISVKLESEDEDSLLTSVDLLNQG